MGNRTIKLIVTLLTSVTLSGQMADTGIQKEIENSVVELMHRGDIPGLTLVLVTEQGQKIMTFGYADLESGERIGQSTLFELASCSKAFTALAVETLVVRGDINMDAKVSEYIPGFRVTYKNQPVSIKIRHLLHHTSGIPWNTLASIPESTGSDALKITVDALKGQELIERPGKKYHYATINYDVLARIVEIVTEGSFEDYIQDKVFDSLGLDNTTIGMPKTGLPMAKGHKIGFFSARPYVAPKYRGNNAAGYIFSNGEDMAKWLKYQLGISKTALHPLIIKTHERDRSVPPHGIASYAMGWEVSLSGNDELGHSGMNPNFTAHVILRPDDQLGIAVMANSNSTYTSLIADQVRNILIGEDIDKAATMDNNNDGFFSMLSIAFAIYILLVLTYVIWSIFEAVKGGRYYAGFNFQQFKRFLAPIPILFPFVIGLYLLPKATIGFDWQSILVWTPGSAYVLLVLVIVSITVSYLAYIVGLLFSQRGYYKKQLPQVLVFSVLSGLSNVLLIIMITSALNSPMELKYLVFYYVLVLSVYLLGRRFVQVRLTKIAVSLVYDMRLKVLSKVLGTTYQKLEPLENGRVFSVVNDDTNYIGRSAGLFVNLITSLITILGTFVYLFSISSWATLLVVTLMVVLTLLYNFVSRSAHKFLEEARDEQNRFMNLINGLVHGLKEISQNRRKKREYRDDLMENALRFKEKNIIAEVKFINGFMVGESLLLVLLGIVSMGLSRLFPDISFYTLMSFIIILLYLIGPINSVLATIPEVMRVKVAWNRIQKFLEEIPEDMKPIASDLIPDFGNVKSYGVNDVYFNYDDIKGNEGNFGIGPINFEIKQGEALFITGGNGSGKTTLAKILVGLYTPSSGTISINGSNVPSVSLSEYFSVVFNPPYLFKKLYGINTMDKRENIEGLLDILQLDDKVSIGENGFSTLDLSSGQRKRLGLLQCYLEDSPIYLFDEWAADQDPEFRKFFYRSLIPRMKKAGKIIIAITHDDHYFDQADKIINMREGKMKASKVKKIMA